MKIEWISEIGVIVLTVAVETMRIEIEIVWVEISGIEWSWASFESVAFNYKIWKRNRND